LDGVLEVGLLEGAGGLWGGEGDASLWVKEEVLLCGVGLEELEGVCEGLEVKL
jgi:hypothetical protein